MQSTKTTVFRSMWRFPNWRRNNEVCARYLRAAGRFGSWFFSCRACCIGVQFFDKYRKGLKILNSIFNQNKKLKKQLSKAKKTKMTMKIFPSTLLLWPNSGFFWSDPSSVSCVIKCSLNCVSSPTSWLVLRSVFFTTILETTRTTLNKTSQWFSLLLFSWLVISNLVKLTFF